MNSSVITVPLQLKTTKRRPDKSQHARPSHAPSQPLEQRNPFLLGEFPTGLPSRPIATPLRNVRLSSFFFYSPSFGLAPHKSSPRLYNAEAFITLSAEKYTACSTEWNSTALHIPGVWFDLCSLVSFFSVPTREAPGTLGSGQCDLAHGGGGATVAAVIYVGVV